MKQTRITLIFIALAGSCFGQTITAERYVNRLLDRWRWMKYWEDKTDLGVQYREGMKIPALFFWRADETVDSAGFCSVSLRVCHFYPSLSTIQDHFEMTTPPGSSLASAFQKFSADAFEQYEMPRFPGSPRPPSPLKGEYKTEQVMITLRKLEPPDSIVQRKVRPQREIDSLVRQLGCVVGRSDCNFRVLIPFYSEHDLWVPVYRECLSECSSRSHAILFPKLTKEGWWLGVTNIDTSPDNVKRVLEKINKALMTSVEK